MKAYSNEVGRLKDHRTFRLSNWAMAAGVGAAVALVGLLSGCQPGVSVQTHAIDSMPPLAQHPRAYVANVVLTGPSAGVDAGRINKDPITLESKPEFGLAVYLAHCASCHGQVNLKLLDKRGEIGKPRPGVPDLSDPLFAWTRTPQEYFRDLLSSPAHQQIATLDRQLLWDAVFYAWHLHSTVDDIVQGGANFGKYCSVCHGTKGRGDGNLAGDLNPAPRQFIDFNWMVDKTDQRLYISISDGRPPSAMPAWKVTLSPTQRIQIINYLRQFTYLYPEDIQKKMAELPPPT